MCSPIPCNDCGKVTWAGCGQHVDQVMASIPENQRCEGHAGQTYGDRLFSMMFGGR